LKKCSIYKYIIELRIDFYIFNLDFLINEKTYLEFRDKNLVKFIDASAFHTKKVFYRDFINKKLDQQFC